MHLNPPVRRILFHAALLAAVPVFGWSQIALVSVTTCQSEAFPGSCTIPATGSGHLIVVGLNMEGSGTGTTITSITDNAGNAYAEAGAARAIVGGSDVTDIWYVKSSVAGATTLNFTPSASTPTCIAVVWEFSGINTSSPLDQTAVLSNQAATATPSGASVTTTLANELVISLADVANHLTGIAAGNAFTNDSTAFGNGWAHLITSTVGTYSAQWNQSSAGTYASSTASFRGAANTPGFTLSALPPSQSVVPGNNATYAITVTGFGGFAGTVNLSASGVPTGASASFNPTSINTTGTSTLTVTTGSSMTAASYPLTITASSGSLIQPAGVTLAITPTPNACDVNKDGQINIIDSQLAANNAVSCSTTPFQTFYSQVISGILSTCPVTTGMHTVSLNWIASPTSGVTYNLYRATTSGGYNYNAPFATGISGTSFTDCTVVLGQSYYYVVRAIDASGNPSANSSEVSVTVPGS